jgi:hypothetical protein
MMRKDTETVPSKMNEEEEGRSDGTDTIASFILQMYLCYVFVGCWKSLHTKLNHQMASLLFSSFFPSFLPSFFLLLLILTMDDAEI